MTETTSPKTNPAIKLAQLAADAADKKLGRNIAILDVRGQSSVADCFVFVSATSHLHVRSLEDGVREAMREGGATLIRTDGQRGNVWRVLDYGSVMVHLMDEKTREFYSVERLWDQAKNLAPKKAEAKKNAPKKFASKKKSAPKKRAAKKAAPKRRTALSSSRRRPGPRS